VLIGRLLEVHESIEVVSSRETVLIRAGFVLLCSLKDVGGDTDVQRAIGVRDDVNVPVGPNRQILRSAQDKF
jgi:hypothetical protein